ncbi:MAG TPA: hypothetical protein VKK79_20150 [Candidatus Lokiarchaeia archaeon]|nr:hypothetical protein [Candidatus Lokiarchaeia archaeon]
MTTVSIDRTLFEELVNTKLNQISDQINQILHKWDYDSIEAFLIDTANGTLPAADEDAALLVALETKRNDLSILKNTDQPQARPVLDEQKYQRILKSREKLAKIPWSSPTREDFINFDDADLYGV